jgi:peptide/nickel transport system permease protein
MLLVIATFQVTRMIIAEASLSYLGLGIDPRTPSWGGMAADGRDYLSSAWWIATLPGLVIAAVGLSFNLFGDWLRDHIDPVGRLD